MTEHITQNIPGLNPNTPEFVPANLEYEHENVSKLIKIQNALDIPDVDRTKTKELVLQSLDIHTPVSNIFDFDRLLDRITEFLQLEKDSYIEKNDNDPEHTQYINAYFTLNFVAFLVKQNIINPDEVTTGGKARRLRRRRRSAKKINRAASTRKRRTPR
jgi:hypothetical protein